MSISFEECKRMLEEKFDNIANSSDFEISDEFAMSVFKSFSSSKTLSDDSKHNIIDTVNNTAKKMEEMDKTVQDIYEAANPDTFPLFIKMFRDKLGKNEKYFAKKLKIRKASYQRMEGSPYIQIDNQAVEIIARFCTAFHISFEKIKKLLVCRKMLPSMLAANVCASGGAYGASTRNTYHIQNKIRLITKPIYQLDMDEFSEKVQKRIFEIRYSEK